MFLDAAWRDVRLAARALTRRAGFSWTVIATLALAIGVTTSLFTLVNEIVLRPLPGVIGPGLVNVHIVDARQRSSFVGSSFATYVALREAPATLTDLAAFSGRILGLQTTGRTELVTGQMVSPTFFAVLGTRAHRGRLLGDPDSPRTGHMAAVVSYGFWSDRLGFDEQVIGRPLRINGHVFTIVGVAERGFRGHFIGFPAEVFVPIEAAPDIAPDIDLQGPADRSLELIGRLRAGASAAAAQAELGGVVRRLATSSSDVPRDFELTVEAWNGVDAVLRAPALGLLGMFAAVSALVLLIACVNVSSLLLQQTHLRRREMAVQLALGAAPWRVARLHLVEALLLCGAAGAVGLIVAVNATGLVHALLPLAPVRVGFDLAIDWRVFAFAWATSGACAIGCGLAPILVTLRIDPIDGLKRAGPTVAGQRTLGRQVMVAGQVALSLMLLVNAALLVKGLRDMAARPLGFDATDVTVATVDFSTVRRDQHQRRAFLEGWRAGVSQQPGVAGVTLAQTIPHGFTEPTMMVRTTAVEGTDGQGIRMRWNAVAPGYFDTLRIPLAGRDFTPADADAGERVAILSVTAARRLFPGREPLGQFVDRAESHLRVIGIVGDVAAHAADQEASSIYVPLGLQDVSRVTLFARGVSRRPELLAAEARRLEPDIPVFNLQALGEHVDGTRFLERMAASVVGGLGTIGLALGAIGLYGVVALVAERRRRELAIRLALGATPLEIRGLVWRDGGFVMAGGLLAGGPASYGLSRLTSALVPGLGQWDATAFAIAGVVLAAVVVASADLPARRAARLDPMRTLRRD